MANANEVRALLLYLFVFCACLTATYIMDQRNHLLEKYKRFLVLRLDYIVPTKQDFR